MDPATAMLIGSTTINLLQGLNQRSKARRERDRLRRLGAARAKWSWLTGDNSWANQRMPEVKSLMDVGLGAAFGGLKQAGDFQTLADAWGIGGGYNNYSRGGTGGGATGIASPTGLGGIGPRIHGGIN